MGTSKVNSSRKTVLQCERDSRINVTMPAGHTLPLTFAFDFTASYLRISSVVPEPEPVIFKRFRFWLRFRPQPSGSTGSGPHPWFGHFHRDHQRDQHTSYDPCNRLHLCHACDVAKTVSKTHKNECKKPNSAAASCISYLRVTFPLRSISWVDRTGSCYDWMA